MGASVKGSWLSSAAQGPWVWGGTGYPYLGGMGSQAQGRDNGKNEQGLGEVFTKKRQE